MEPATLQSLLDLEYFVIFHLVAAIFEPLHYDSFIYWPFLLSSLLIAGASWLYWRRHGIELGWRQIRARFFSARLWWHRSARADYRLFLTNALLVPALFSVFFFEAQDMVDGLNRLLGIARDNAGQDASIAWKLAYTAAFFVAYDFGRFVAHSLLHDVPFLWEFHKVHHSAAVLTPMTAYRVHPVDLTVMKTGGALASGIMAWGFNQMAGGTVNAYLFMGLNVFLWLSNLFGNLNHTPVWLHYGATLNKWLISPAHHQLHHSCETRHLGCNRGFQLAVWDRLYGTLYLPHGAEEQYALGLDDGTTERWHTVRHMLFQPFLGAARVILQRANSASAKDAP